MSIITMASGASCWRGLDYYHSKKVKIVEKINDDEYKSIVSGTDKYDVYLNLLHPRKSTCNCPHANGKRIICKHIVATYFTLFPNEADKYEKQQYELEEEYEKEQEIIYDNLVKCLNKKSKSQLVTDILLLLEDVPEWIYDDFVRMNGIDPSYDD